MQMIRSVLLVSRGQNKHLNYDCWVDGRPTRVSTAGHLNKVAFLKAIREKLNMPKPNKMGHQNKVAFLNAIREELNMPKPKKSKSEPKGVQFRRAAKKRESVKGVLVTYIYLTIFDILIIRYLLKSLLIR